MRILIAAPGSEREFAAELGKALAALGFVVSLSEPSKGAGLVGGNDILYVFDAEPALLAAGLTARVLSVSGKRSTVEAGHASVGIVPEAGKPKLVVHASRLKAEGHALAASVLSFCQVIR